MRNTLFVIHVSLRWQSSLALFSNIKGSRRRRLPLMFEKSAKLDCHLKLCEKQCGIYANFCHCDFARNTQFGYSTSCGPQNLKSRGFIWSRDPKVRSLLNGFLYIAGILE